MSPHCSMSWARARATRERIVPTGTSTTSAASWYSSPRSCVSTNAVRRSRSSVDRSRSSSTTPSSAGRDGRRSPVVQARRAAGGGAAPCECDPRTHDGRSTATMCGPTSRLGTTGAQPSARMYASCVTSSAASRSVRWAHNRHTSAWLARTNAASATRSPSRAARASAVRSSTAPPACRHPCRHPKAGGHRELSIPSDDYQYMQCDEIREAISAAADGEATPLERSMVDAHIARCAGCAAFAGAVEQLDRRLRIRPAEPVPDLSAADPLGRRAQAGCASGRGTSCCGWRSPNSSSRSPRCWAPAGTRRSMPRTSSARGRRRSPSGCSSRRGSPRRAAGLLPFALALAGAMVATAAFDIVDRACARGGRGAAPPRPDRRRRAVAADPIGRAVHRTAGPSRSARRVSPLASPPMRIRAPARSQRVARAAGPRRPRQPRARRSGEAGRLHVDRHRDQPSRPTRSA